METRDLDLKRIRPDFMTTTINDGMSADERFQNLILRPIIKLQRGLFIEVFKNYVANLEAERLVPVEMIFEKPS